VRYLAGEAGIGQFLADADEPRSIVAELVDALPPGSYLAVSHATADFNPEEIDRVAGATRHAGVTFAPRTQAGVTAFFGGLDLVDPGVVPVLAWRPDGEPPADPRAAYNYAAVGRKP
jgi:hypothetical protein